MTAKSRPSILDEVNAATTRSSHRCTIAVALSNLDPATRAEFVEVIAGDAQGSAIARVLSRHFGRDVRPQTLQRHRRGECSCGRS